MRPQPTPLPLSSETTTSHQFRETAGNTNNDSKNKKNEKINGKDRHVRSTTKNPTQNRADRSRLRRGVCTSIGNVISDGEGRETDP